MGGAPTRDVGLVFAGGGNRAFYQLGLLRHLGDRLSPRLAAVATCSAGACVAAIYFTGRESEAWRFWLDRRAGVTRNLDWSKLLRGERPAPHAEVYRDTMLHILAEGGFARIRALPFPFLVLSAAYPSLLPTALAVPLGLGSYSLDRAVLAGLHPVLPRRLGFRPAVYDARDCADAEEMTDLVLASSATPPFTPVGAYRGRRLLDGGMVDNAPAFVAEEAPAVRRTIVLLTRPYPSARVGRRGARLYLAPSAPTPADRWDYTRPERVVETQRLGERDAEHHGATVNAFMDGDGAGALPAGGVAR